VEGDTAGGLGTNLGPQTGVVGGGRGKTSWFVKKAGLRGGGGGPLPFIDIFCPGGGGGGGEKPGGPGGGGGGDINWGGSGASGEGGGNGGGGGVRGLHGAGRGPLLRGGNFRGRRDKI